MSKTICTREQWRDRNCECDNCEWFRIRKSLDAGKPRNVAEQEPTIYRPPTENPADAFVETRAQKRKRLQREAGYKRLASAVFNPDESRNRSTHGRRCADQGLA